MGDDPLTRIELLEQRVELLESHVRAVQARVDTAGAVDAARDEPSTWATPVQGAPPWPAPAPVPASQPTRPAFAFDSEVALKWGGVGLVVLAVGFAVSTAISRGWIGPELQLAGALAVSLALIATGVRLRSRRPAWTHALGTGGVLALFTTFASDLFLEQANDDVAFASTAAVVLTGLVLSRHVDSEWVASSVIVGAATGWSVIADGDPPVLVTVALIVATGIAAIAMSVARDWQAVRPVAHLVAMISILAVAGEAGDGVHEALVLIAAALLAASLLRVPSIGDLTPIRQQLGIQLTIFTGPWAFSTIAVALDLETDTTLGTVAVSVAAGTALAALGVRRAIAAAHLVSLLIGASIVLSIGLAFLLATTATFTALAVQGAGLVVLSRALNGHVRVLINAAVVLAVSGAWALAAMIDAWSDDVSIADDVSHIAIIAAIAGAAWQTRHLPVQRVGAVVVLSLVLIWLGSVLVHLPQGQAAVSVSWAIIGTIVLVAGAVRKRPEVGGVGLAVLALTVGKLLTVDLQEVDTLWRAGLFFLVGLGLLRLGFLLPRLWKGDEHD